MGKEYCIYIHINKINNKVYIGQTSQFPPSKRWLGGEGYQNCPKFYNAIKKYGWDNFEHIILEKGLTLIQANEKEQYYIKLYNSIDNGYNIKVGGSNSELTKEHKNKIRKSNQKVFKQKFESDEYRNKMRKIHIQAQGKKVICLETGKIFDSQTLAAEWCGLKTSSHISGCCKGKRKTAGGYHWKFI